MYKRNLDRVVIATANRNHPYAGSTESTVAKMRACRTGSSVVATPQTGVADKDILTMSAKENTAAQEVQNAQEFASLAMSMLAEVPASLLVSHDERPKGNAAANAKALVDSVSKPSERFTYDDVQTWTYTRKGADPSEGTFREAIAAGKQAVTTTHGDVYLERPTRGSVEIKLHRVSADPLAVAKVIARDASIVKRLAAKKETDHHRQLIADMQVYLANALSRMSDEQREELGKYIAELGK